MHVKKCINVSSRDGFKPEYSIQQCINDECLTHDLLLGGFIFPASRLLLCIRILCVHHSRLLYH